MTKKLIALSLMSLFTATVPAEEKEMPGPCHRIRVACESVGYAKGKHKPNKGLYVDCMKPVISGQSISGIKVKPADITDCKKQEQVLKDNNKQGKDAKKAPPRR